jgi:hypothetical protein
LKAWWPTFGFFARQESPKSIKIHPTALGPALPDSHVEPSTPELEIIEKYYKEQNHQANQIACVLTMAEDTGTHPCSVDSPVALAILCSLVCGSFASKDDETKLREMIGNNPVAAYILAHIGCCPGERQDFIRQIMADPYLALDLCVEGLFGHLLPDELLSGSLEKVPHLRPFIHFAQRQLNDHDAWDALVDIAENDPLAAAFALGLDPTHSQAKEWHPLVAPTPEAIYWALRVWGTHQPKATDFPYWLEFQALVKKDLRWLFHWVRDIDATEAREVARWHWPDPWAIEIIVDLELEPDFVRDLFQGSFQNSDNDDPLASTLSLWAAGYVSPQKTSQNETSD